MSLTVVIASLLTMIGFLILLMAAVLALAGSESLSKALNVLLFKRYIRFQSMIKFTNSENERMRKIIHQLSIRNVDLGQAIKELEDFNQQLLEENNRLVSINRHLDRRLEKFELSSHPSFDITRQLNGQVPEND